MLFRGLGAMAVVGAATAAPAFAQEDEEWTVEHTWAPTEQVRFEVSEGTWMDLDVSPDGETIGGGLVSDLEIEAGPAARVVGLDLRPRSRTPAEEGAHSSDPASVASIEKSHRNRGPGEARLV